MYGALPTATQGSYSDDDEVMAGRVFNRSGRTCDDSDGSSVFLLSWATGSQQKGPNTEVVDAVDQVTPARV